MSNISSQIAASVSQAMLQQSQTARKRDAISNTDREHARKLRELIEKHVEQVEDSQQTDPVLGIDPHREHADHQPKRHDHREAPQPPEPSGDHTIDIEA